MFLALVLVGPSKQLKKIFQIEHNIVKNPHWLEANQLDIYKRGRGFELGATEKQIQVVVRAGLEPGTVGLRVRHAEHSATLNEVTALLIPAQKSKGWVTGKFSVIFFSIKRKIQRCLSKTFT